MEALHSSRQVTLQIPVSDTPFVRSLARRFGWTMQCAKPYEPEPNRLTLKAVEDARNGKTHKATSVDDLFKQLMED